MAKRTQRIKPEPIDPDNRKVITDVICKVMHEHHRDDSIDRLLCRPLDAARMAVTVAQACGQISPADADAVRAKLARVMSATCAELLNTVCRIALSSRKRGDLRSDAY